jgi:cell division protein ZipA
LSIVAKTAAGFTGKQLLEAFKNAGLTYGSVKVFEKLDDLNQVDYAVASM